MENAGEWKLVDTSCPVDITHSRLGLLEVSSPTQKPRVKHGVACRLKKKLGLKQAKQAIEQRKLPSEWKGFYIIFPGTIRKSSAPGKKCFQAVVVLFDEALGSWKIAYVNGSYTAAGKYRVITLS
ncbi:MAG: hypothetical protein JNN11_04180 [Candidatus Doudnabacteria bacterium]|nr:hypothetical protein [Candidatus Doudnabacteria bacterium]